MNIWEREELYPLAQSYNKKSVQMSPHPVLMSSTFRRVLFCHMSSRVLNEQHGQFHLKSPCNWPTAL